MEMDSRPINNRKKRKKIRWIPVLYIILAFGSGSFIGFNLWIIRSLPQIDILKNYYPVLATRLYDRNGEHVRDVYLVRRIPVLLDSIPENLQKAVISIEDKAFYRHHGLNYKRIVKAIIVDIIKRKKVQGASTITQQLARNILLSLEKSWIRKISEMYLAIELERYYTKKDILEMYLNQVYYGYGNYGVEAASEFYFGKPVSEVTLKEAAFLAGIIRSPGYYSPYTHPVRCDKRIRIVLKEMLEDGYIDSTQYREALDDTLKFVQKEERKTVGPYYIEEVKKILSGILGKAYVTTGGYTVYLGMDKKLQEIADSVTEVTMERIEKKYRLKPMGEFPESMPPMDNTPYLQCAMVVMDPHTGDVLAMIGGRNIRHSRFNRATMAKRQAGSSFKAFLYTAAIDNGYNPSDFVLDLPIITQVNEKVYAPANFDSTFMGKITLRRALYLSRNSAAIRLVYEIGPFTVIDYAHRMGVKSKLDPVISIPLGPSGVTVLEMTDAFGTLANYGTRIEPVIVKKIIDRFGNVVYEYDPPKERVLSKQTAYIMINMLMDVFNHGTAFGARRMGFMLPAAGKTGTTNNFQDAWFIGFTREYVAGVWVGYDVPRKIATNATGAGAALPLWVSFMKAVYDSVADTTDVEFPVPDSIVRRVICEDSGLLATPYCPRVREEVFIKGNEPDEKCDIHAGKKKERLFERRDRIEF